MLIIRIFPHLNSFKYLAFEKEEPTDTLVPIEPEKNKKSGRKGVRVLVVIVLLAVVAVASLIGYSNSRTDLIKGTWYYVKYERTSQHDNNKDEKSSIEKLSELTFREDKSGWLGNEDKITWSASMSDYTIVTKTPYGTIKAKIKDDLLIIWLKEYPNECF